MLSQTRRSGSGKIKRRAIRGRRGSTAFIASLTNDDFLKVLPSSDFGMGLSIAHWLLITVSHGAIHIGRIQMLRAMLEGKYDRTC